ncbi:MAG TPA: glycosyltransferase [Thermoanaerobaculia bacterium]|nr:glycosyltransferase [Thermoanaerobaculia bacterium]
MPSLAAALCTRNRPIQLARALTSLAAQSRPPDEVLVIDNAPSSRETRELVAREFPDVRYVQEPLPGLDFARNRALCEAGSEVVAFLDDDAVAHRDWCRCLAAAFEDGRVGVATGRIEPLALDTEGRRLFEENGGFSRGTLEIRLPRDTGRPLHGRAAPAIAWAVSMGCGASLAVRRSAALTAGGFDEALDMGPRLPGGGDHDMLWRLLAAGHEVVYRPDAMVWHEHRAEKQAAYDQIVGHQHALVAFLTKHVLGREGGGRLPVLAFLAWRLVKPGVRLARRAAGRDPLPAAVLLRMWWSCWSGLAAYPAARREAQRLRREVA